MKRTEELDHVMTKNILIISEIYLLDLEPVHMIYENAKTETSLLAQRID